jgi:TonB-linked SusC/RagA family outer membrane protein
MITAFKKQGVFFALLLVLSSLSSRAQIQENLSGKVTDQGGVPIPNVSISIEGSSLSGLVLTDTAGRFILPVPEGDQWVLINPSGKYKPKRIYLNHRLSLDIKLIPLRSASIHDPLNIMNQLVESRNMTGSYSPVDISDMNTLPYETMEQHLTGKTAGLFSTGHSGKPGEGNFLSLRGSRSPYSNGQPAIVVDGLLYETHGLIDPMLEGNVFNPLASIAPLDITSITVLKDASAGALYGSRGSNGVIFIETLKATETRTIIDLDSRFGMRLAPRQQPLLNNRQFRTLSHELLLSGGYEEENMREEFPGLFDDPSSEEYHRFKHNTNWQDQIFRNALMTDIMLRVKGGDANAKYGLSFGYQNNQSVIKETNSQRYNLRFTSTFNVLPWLNLNVNSNLTYNASKIKETGLSNTSSPIVTALFKAPVMAPFQFDADGNQLKYYDNPSSFNVSNPTAIIDLFEGNIDNYRLITSARINANFTDHLSASSLVGVNLNHLREIAFYPNEGMVDYYDGEVYNSSIHQVNSMNAIFNENNLVYSPISTRTHRLNIQGGLRISTISYEEDAGIGKNAHINDQYKALQNGASILREISGRNDQWNWMSMYSDVNYIFRDKYLLGANATLDGSSRTGKEASTDLNMFGTPFGLFYSFRAGWRLSNEQWLRDLSWLDELKLRASWGSAGNDDIGVYNSSLFYVSSHYRTASGLYMGTQANPGLKYETVYTGNAGVDIHLFGERLNMALDFYNSRTEDMLIFERIESFLGFLYYPSNGGSVSNKGYELNLNAGLVRSGNLTWDVNFNVGKFKNQVEQIKGGQVIVNIPGGQMILKEGQPMNSFYGYISDGIFKDTEEANAAQLVNERGIAFSAGDVHFRDISGPDGVPDSVINSFDKTIIGSSYPDFYGDISTRISYGRWSVSGTVKFVIGNDAYNYTRYLSERMVDLSNQSVSTLRRWVSEGQITDIPRATLLDPVGNNAFSSRWIEDGSYIRLQNITLSYTIPDRLGAFRYAQVFVTATNLLTWTKYLGYDPEFSYSWNQLEQGIDYGQVPYTGTFLVGIKLGL